MQQLTPREVRNAQARQRWAADPERARAKQRAKYHRKQLRRLAAELSRWEPGPQPLMLMPPKAPEPDGRRRCSLCDAADPPCGFVNAGNWCRDCKAERDRADRRRREGRQTTRFTAGPCHECGTTFVAVATGARFCSAMCATRGPRRRYKQLRRARERATMTEPINLKVVAERDGWRCHICKRKVGRATWSLDHLVPLAAGGSHTYQNVALAHHRCNTLRRDTGAAQLRLVS